LIRIEWASPLADSSGAALAAECARNPVCAKHLGPHPVFQLRLVFELLHAGQLECNAKLAHPTTVQEQQALFGELIRDPVKRLLIFPIVRRLLRCNAGDVTALNHALQPHQHTAPVARSQLSMPIEGAPPNTTLITNSLLGFVIGSSEFHEYRQDPITEEQVTQMDRGLTVTNKGDTSLFSAMAAPGYSPYADPLSHHYPNTTTNLVMIEGTLDPQTTPEWAEHAMTHYTAPNQRLVSVPYAVHAAASLPGRTIVTDGGPDCGFQLAASFYATSGESIDTSCVQKLQIPDFGGEQEATKKAGLAMFGTEDIWG